MLPTVYLTPAAEECLHGFADGTRYVTMPDAVARELIEMRFCRSAQSNAEAGYTTCRITDAGSMHLDDMLGENRP